MTRILQVAIILTLVACVGGLFWALMAEDSSRSSGPSVAVDESGSVRARQGAGGQVRRVPAETTANDIVAATDSGEIIYLVGDDPEFQQTVTYGQLEREMAPQMEEVSMLPPTQAARARERIERDARRRLITTAAMLYEARQQGFETDPDKLDEIWQTWMSQFPSSDAAGQALARIGQTTEGFHQQLEDEILISSMVADWQMGEASPSEQALEVFYTKNQHRYNSPFEMFRIQQVLCYVPEENDTQAWQVAAASAEAAMDLIRSGSDFTAVVRDMSDYVGRRGDGDLGWIQKERLPPELAQALESMQTGEVSAPLKTEAGYMIVKKAGYRPEGVPPLAEIRDRITEDLMQEELMPAYVESIRQKVPVYDAEGNQVDLSQ